MKVCQLPIRFAREIQDASPFPPAIFANVGLMIVVCDVYLLLSQALPHGIAVDVAREDGCVGARVGPSDRPIGGSILQIKSYLGVLDDSVLAAAVVHS